MEEEREGQGFTVRDRRIFSPDSDEKAKEEKPSEKQESESKPEQEPREERQERAQTVPLPEPSFSSFLTFFFFQQALMYLGDIPHPESQQVEKNLPMASYLIDTLAIIKEKTQGNLSPEEQSQLENFLTELRMRYVKAAEA